MSLTQQITAVAATLAVIGLFVLLVNLSGRQPQALLFSGLDPKAAGEVAAELDGLGTEYSVRGSAIYVPESDRDRLRIELAREGLPAASTDGYELLDTLNGFSTTSDMFDAAYWRAKEGELTRTLLAMPNVKAARVHLGVTRQSAFRRRQSDISASVTIDAPRGLDEDQARSIQYLTALAVANLSPDMVAVIDTNRGVIAGPGAADNGDVGTGPDKRSAELEARLTRLLEAHVGMGNARVTVAMDIDRTAIAQTERMVDPETRQVASRSLTEERDVEALGANGGAVTVASNLPDGDAAEPPADEGALKRMRRDEKVVYTGTEIERVTEQRPGAINRLSVAVLLNQRFTVDEEGNTVPLPRSQEELDALEALVLSAAGITPARGDTLTLRILPFELPQIEDAPAPTFVETYVLPQSVQLIQMGLVGLIAIILALFVLRPILSGSAIPLAKAEIADQNGQVDAATLLTMLTKENPDDVAAVLDEWFEDEPQKTSLTA